MRLRRQSGLARSPCWSTTNMSGQAKDAWIPGDPDDAVSAWKSHTCSHIRIDEVGCTAVTRHLGARRCEQVPAPTIYVHPYIGGVALTSETLAATPARASITPFPSGRITHGRCTL